MKMRTAVLVFTAMSACGTARKQLPAPAYEPPIVRYESNEESNAKWARREAAEEKAIGFLRKGYLKDFENIQFSSSYDERWGASEALDQFYENGGNIEPLILMLERYVFQTDLTPNADQAYAIAKFALQNDDWPKWRRYMENSVRTNNEGAISGIRQAGVDKIREEKKL